MIDFYEIVFNEIVFNGLVWTCMAAWKAAPVCLVVFLLTSLFRNRLPARVHCLLWLVVIARLLLPVSIESPIAIDSGINRVMATLFVNKSSAGGSEFETFTFQNEEGESTVFRMASLPVDATVEERKQAESEVVVFEATSIEHAVIPSGDQVYNIVDDQSVALEVAFDLVMYTIIWGWLTGVLVLGCRGSFAYVRFAGRLRQCSIVEDQTVVDQVLRACDQVGVGRRPLIREVESLSAPAVFGLFRPVICLPKSWQERLPGERLDWVLRHELAHVKRRDAMVLFVAGIARALHWFHPLSWVAFTKLHHNMERAADEMATRKLDQVRVRQYGELLLEYAAGQSSSHGQATMGLLAMAKPKGLQSRIESLGTERPRNTWLRRMLIVPSVALIATSGLTDAKMIEQPPVSPRQIPNIEVAIAGSDWQRPDPWNSRPAEKEMRTVSINVKKALRKAGQLQPGVDAEAFVMNYFALSPTTADQREDTGIVDGVLTAHMTRRHELLMKQRLSAFEQSGLWQIVIELRVMETDVRLLNQFDWSASDTTTQCRRLDRRPMLSDDEWTTTYSTDAMSWPQQDTTPWNVDHSASVPVRAIKISRLQSEHLIHQMQRDSRSNLMQAPKVTMFNGQSGMISDVVQRPFVTDVFALPGDSASVLQPKISVFEDGWRFLMKPTVTKEEKVNMQLVLTHSSIDGVKLANLPRLGVAEPDGEVTIQVPTVHSDSIAVASVFDGDEALLVFSPKPFLDDPDSTNAISGRGMGQVFMIRTQLLADRDVLAAFLP